MHQLILMRHAKAEGVRSGLADHERALAPEGRDSAAALGERLRALGLAPDVVLVSSARRTRETLRALAPWEEQPNIEVLDALYMATVPQALAIIRDLRETMRSVLILGHNPGIHELAVHLADASHAPGGMLAGLRDGFPTASLAEYLVLTPWRELKPSRTRLQRFLTPEG